MQDLHRNTCIGSDFTFRVPYFITFLLELQDGQVSGFGGSKSSNEDSVSFLDLVVLFVLFVWDPFIFCIMGIRLFELYKSTPHVLYTNCEWWCSMLEMLDCEKRME